MKGLRLILCFSLALSLMKVIKAQDVHFSMFNMSPLTLNPANTGAFNGTVRIGGIYRDQWASFLNDQFTTPSFYADAPIIRGFGKNDWVGVGFVAYQDKAGTLELGTNAFLFSGAYHRALKKNSSDQMLTLGVQAGRINRLFKTDRITLGDAVDFSQPQIPTGASFDQALSASGMEQDLGFFDISAGLLLNSRLDDMNKLQLGFAVAHINKGKYGFTSVQGESNPPKRPMLFTGHGRFEHQFDEKWSITPGFLFRTTEGTKPEIMLQSWAGRVINDEFTLNFGAGYRIGDAAQLLVGVDYLEDLRVALSYDINVSTLNEVSKYQGGFELAAYYIIKIYKEPDVTPTVVCPQF